MKREKKVNQRKVRTKAYLTKRVLLRAARQGFTAARAETMKVMGYNVVAQDGRIVKLFPDGRVERIHEIERVAAQK